MAPRQAQLSPQQQADLASLMYGLAQDPKTRKDLAKLVKKVNPERAAMSFRDVDQEDRFEKLREDLEEKFDLNGARAAKARQDEQRAKLGERYSPEQVTEVEAIATKYGMSDLDAAAVLYAHEHPESDPTLQPPRPDRRSATWEFPTVQGKDGKDLGFKEFAGDLKHSSLDAAYRVIDELNAFKGKTLSPAFGRR